MRKHAIRAAVALAVGGFTAVAGVAIAQSLSLTGSTAGSTIVAITGAVAPAPTATSAVGGRVNVVAYLKDAPLAAALAAARPANAPRKTVVWSAEQQRAYVADLRAQQAVVAGAAQALGAEVVGNLVNASNGVLMTIDESSIPALQNLASVASVMLVEDGFKHSLPAVAEYVQATSLQNRVPGIDGTGMRIAVLDSGVDYTHFNLGGPGTIDAFTAAYGVPRSAGCQVTPANTGTPTFTSKVVGGFDFVGERWPTFTDSLEPDPNPIDCEGHGSSVADIAAGRSADGTWAGMAPGAQVYAVKVCSAVSSSCSGLAILQGLDFSLDPNQDGDLSDAVDVVNMSLGANYGQRENPSSYSTKIVSQFGTLVVASAGNGSDFPFINGSPSSSPEAIAVAQTQVPDSFIFPLVTSPGGTNRNTAYQSWSDPIVADISAPIASDPNLASGGCAPYAAGAFAGRIALIARGTCAISVKTANASNAGAVAVLISDNLAAAEPPSFSFGGGGTVFRSTLAITQAAGNALRSALTAGAVDGTVSFSGRFPIVGSVVATSSRGPNNGYNMIKPDVGAPGASLSLAVGTGNGNRVFGGTSGAAPVVAGAAALVLQKHPTLHPHEVKARLMGHAERNILTNPGSLSNVLAPITRIGGGEVRAANAVDSTTAMWDAGWPAAGSLSFGYQPVVGTNRVLRKRVIVRNYSNVARTYTIGRSFRYADDAASGAVTLQSPASITVAANSSNAFVVQMTINPSLLPVWAATGLANGANYTNGALLQRVEFDGYVTVTSGGQTTSLPWHVLPRRSHQGVATPAVDAMTVSNVGGSTTASAEVFALTGTSPQLPYEAFPGPGDSFQVVDLRAAGVRSANIGTAPVWAGSTAVQFGVSRWDARSHPNMNQTVQIVIDTDRDGVDDWRVFAGRTTGFQNAAFFQRLNPACPEPTGCPTSGFFFTNADIMGSNYILTIPAQPVYAGAPATIVNPNQPFNFRVEGLDNYFTGAVTDVIPTMTHTLTLPKYQAALTSFGVPVGLTAPIPVSQPAGGAAASPSQSGLLVLWSDGMPGREASLVTY